jgi:NADH-quinone oxidoreductase subunit L
MVTAGVYMVARSNVLYRLSPAAMMVVAIIGGLTALFAATIGLRQFDIKKVLAYSTVSQLGFMMIGVGVGAFSAGVFHLVTHAFFKACLFLGSGSVIHAMSGEQDIRNMGGLKSKIPITFWTFLIATIAIAGFPPLSGFFSKDEILASAFVTPYFPGVGKFIYVLGSLAAFCTSFYMYRLVYLTFYGKFRGTHEQEHHLHESPATMTGPLVILAALSVFGGLLGLPHVIGHNFLGHWLGIEGFEIPASTEWLVMGLSTLIAVAGWFFAMRLYRDRGLAADQAFEQRSPALARAIENKWYVDELYAAIVVRPLGAISHFFWKGVDALIDGLAAMLGFVVRGFGDILRFFQTGNVRNYALMFFVGVVVFMVWFV